MLCLQVCASCEPSWSQHTFAQNAFSGEKKTSSVKIKWRISRYCGWGCLSKSQNAVPTYFKIICLLHYATYYVKYTSTFSSRTPPWHDAATKHHPAYSLLRPCFTVQILLQLTREHAPKWLVIAWRIQYGFLFWSWRKGFYPSTTAFQDVVM